MPLDLKVPMIGTTLWKRDLRILRISVAELRKISATWRISLGSVRKQMEALSLDSVGPKRLWVFYIGFKIITGQPIILQS
jgi:hypothetical protein